MLSSLSYFLDKATAVLDGSTSLLGSSNSKKMVSRIGVCPKYEYLDPKKPPASATAAEAKPKLKKRVRFESSKQVPTLVVVPSSDSCDDDDDEKKSSETKAHNISLNGGGEMKKGVKVKILMTKKEAAELLSKCKEGGVLEFKDVARELVQIPPNRVSLA